MLRDNKGITLVALTITIIIILILSTIGMIAGRDSITSAKKNKKIIELEMVHHAVLERYAEYRITGDEELLVGKAISYETTTSLAQGMDCQLPESGTYYKLENYTEGGIEINPLKELGLKVGGSEDLSTDTYVVNYEKGITFNATTKEYKGEILYRNGE